MPDLPPEWYSRIELFFYKNKFWVYVAGYILISFVLPIIFYESEPLDPQLLVGLDDE